MKLFKKLGLPAGVAAIVALILSACGGVLGVSGALSGDQALQHQQNVSNNALARIEQQEPVPVLYDSSDAHNQRIFYTEQSDPNKVEYLTLVGLDGSPYAHFTIKGQVSSMNTQMSNPSQVQCQDGYQSIGCSSVGLAEPNGVYQGNDAGHFAVTTNGALIEWEGNFITSDQPFDLKTPVKLAIQENVAPTYTNTSHVTGGLLPGGRSH